jgi:hypothetical protein
MKIHEGIEQGCVDWLLLRSGKVTASEVDALVSPTGEVRKGIGVKTYLIQKLCEVWIGGPLPQLQGVFDVEQGSILEEYARPAFTLETGFEVKQVSFVTGDDDRIGCSPDGILSDVGAGLELKCPAMPNHIRYLLDGKLPSDYIAQVQFSMYVTGFSQWYFCSFRRNFPPFILKVERDEEYQKTIKTALGLFFESFDAAMAKLIKLNGGLPKKTNRGLVPFPSKYTAGIDHLAGA